MRLGRLFSLVLVGLVVSAGGARADGPPTLADLQEIGGAAEAPPLKTEFRDRGLRQAAWSFGVRGGLAARTFAISNVLERRAWELGAAFDFRQLLVAAPSGLLVQPPVVIEANAAFEVAEEGQVAAVADRTYRIVETARIVPVARDWRSYLGRDWGKVEPPPFEMRPENDEEREKWRRWIEEGWREGVKQADEIFQADVDRMVRDFTGMVRFRVLLAQGMVSMPFAAEQDRGVTGGGDTMRIGDREVRITGPAELRAGSDQWRPVQR